MLRYVEYGYYDFSSSEKETKDFVLESIQYGPSTISVLPQYVKFIKKSMPRNIKLGTIIDYPFGLSDYEERENAVKKAIKYVVDSVEVVCPNHALCNRKYDRFRFEVDTFKKLCVDAQVDLKYVLEYKTFTLPLLHKIADILYTKKLGTIYPSTSYSLDGISDNILVSMMLLKKNPHLNIIVNGQAWTDAHVELILSNEQIFAYKTNNIHILEKLSHKINFLG